MGGKIKALQADESLEGPSRYIWVYGLSGSEWELQYFKKKEDDNHHLRSNKIADYNKVPIDRLHNFGVYYMEVEKPTVKPISDAPEKCCPTHQGCSITELVELRERVQKVEDAITKWFGRSAV